MATESGSLADAEVYRQLFQALKPLFAYMHADFSEPSNANIDKLFSFIAPCMGLDHSTMKEIWQRRGGNNRELIAELQRATNEGGLNYSFLLKKFANSIKPLSVTQTDLIISSYLHEIRPDLESFLKRPEPLRLWVPEKDLPHADFLKSLKIPMSATNGPDMLLHDLGNFKRNEVLQKLVNKLFHPENSGLNFASTLLLNTSGSGKTRTLLEGLCQMWGLYFTCQVDTEGRGSIDLERTINDRIASDPCFHPHLPSIGFDVVHSANSNIAGRRLGEVLLARLCILEFFCEVAREVSNGNLTDEHRKRWVFLQIRPSCIGQAHVDIFNGLAEKIMGVDSRYRRTLIKNKVGKLAAMNIDNKPLFCVVDEAQVAATSLPRAFMTSGPGVDRQRPILKEIAKAFALPQHSIALNLTGTAIDTSVMMEILASPIFKETGMTTITHFGAFNVPTEQIAYVKEFLPKELAESIPFRRLFKRVAYWLKGRYRFTAAYVKDLLSMGFQRPHRLLNEFIRLSTVVPIPGAIALRMSAGFKLTDSKEDWEEGEAVPSPLKRFDFDKLKKDPTVESLIRAHTAKFWMRSTIDPLIADKRHFDLIRYGFARYADNDVGNHEEAKISLDEPLVLLALGEWLQICDLPLAETLRQNAARAVTEASGANGLEEYLALYLSAVFDDQTPLTDIFRFHEHLDPPDWAKKPAALVSLYYVDDEDLLANNPSEGVVEHHKRPSVTIGKDATNIQETLAWLKHTDTFRAPICFPDKFIGPDLLFILRLQDEARSLIWVALQSKFSSDDALSGETIRSALPTVTPKEFYGLRKEERLPPPNSKLVSTTDEQRKKKGEDRRKGHNKEALSLLSNLPRRLRTPALERMSGKQGVDAREGIIKHFTAVAEKAAKEAKEEAKFSAKKGTRTKSVEAIATTRVTRSRANPPKQPTVEEETYELTEDEEEILQGAGVYSLLRVVVGWPAETDLHKRAVKLSDIYFDEENHPVVELNIGHWAKTMAGLHESAGDYVEAVWKGKKRMAVGVAGSSRPKKKQKASKGLAKISEELDEPSVAEVLRCEPKRSITEQSDGDELSVAGLASEYTRATSPPPSTALSEGYSRSSSPHADDPMRDLGEVDV